MTTLLRACRVGLAALVVAGAGDACAAARIDCGETLVAVPAAGAAQRIEPARPAWVEVRELGIDVELARSDGAPIVGVGVPPRFGWTWLQLPRGVALELRRTQVGAASGDVSFHLHCTPDARATREREWLLPLATLTTAVSKGAPAMDPTQVDSAIAASLDSAPTPRTRALALHVQAQRAMLSAKTTEAADAFGRAQAAWLLDGDGRDLARAFAALVARVEELNRKGRYVDVLALSRSLPGAPDASQYYGIRLESARCLAFMYLSRLDEAAGCYAWVLAGYDRRGESIEHAAITVDAAYLQRQRGDGGLARALALQAVARAVGPQADLVRGRARLLIADLDIDAGDLGSALHVLHLADGDFAVARALRWQVNALLKAADLWALLGATGDARAAVEQALGLLDIEDAPARRAVALLQRSRIELLDGTEAAAEESARAAKAIYGVLAMPAEGQQAAALECRASRGRSAACELRASSDAVLTALVAAESALARGDAKSADAQLASLRTADPEIAADILRLRVAAALSSGAPDRAATFARDAASAARQSAVATTNPVLSLLLRRRVDAAVEHGMAAFAMHLDARPRRLSARRARELGLWLGEGVFDDIGAAAAVSPAAAALDAERATRAAGSSAPATIAARLALLESTTASVAASPPVDVLEALARALDPGPSDALIAILPAHGTYVVAARRGTKRPMAWTVPAEALEFRPSADGSPRADLAERAQRIAELVLHRWPDSERVTRWWVVERGPVASIPWSMLPLRNGTVLIEHAVVTRIDPVLAGPLDATAGAPIALFASPVVAGLPALAAVDREGAALASLGFRVVPRASRGDVIAALASPAATVVVSTHGEGQGDRLGGSGLWLGGDRAEYLSGVELLARGVRARDVVLDACAVAAGGRGLDVSVARLVVLAGAQSSVAPLWSVGDEASAFFTQELLAARARGDDVPAATRAAQRALAAQRAWRRPADWAAWTALQRVAIASEKTSR